MTTTVTFTPAVGSPLVLPPPEFPTKPPEKTDIIRGECGGGGVKIYNMGPPGGYEVWPFKWFLDTTYFEALKAFLITTLTWGTLPCTYTDQWSTDHENLYYWDDWPLRFESESGPSKGWWRGETIWRQAVT